MVNAFDDIYIEKNGKLLRSDIAFSSDAAVMSAIERIVSPLGRRIDESSPMVDARLPDGSRVNAIIPPLALRGPTLTIRKFSKKKLTAEDLINFGTINQPMATFLQMAVEQHCNIIISGGTGSGKTTLLNIMSNFIPETERIITVEDAAELKLVQPHVVSLESRPANLEGKGAIPIRDLVRNCLRMRPDRIVVGECRGTGYVNRDEYRTRRIVNHSACQYPQRRYFPARSDGNDGGYGFTRQGYSRANRLGGTCDSTAEPSG